MLLQADKAIVIYFPGFAVIIASACDDDKRVMMILCTAVLNDHKSEIMAYTMLACSH